MASAIARVDDSKGLAGETPMGRGAASSLVFAEYRTLLTLRAKSSLLIRGILSDGNRKPTMQCLELTPFAQRLPKTDTGTRGLKQQPLRFFMKLLGIRGRDLAEFSF